MGKDYNNNLIKYFFLFFFFYRKIFLIFKYSSKWREIVAEND